MLRGKANYDVKKVLELGFAATARLKQTTEHLQKDQQRTKQHNLIQIQILRPNGGGYLEMLQELLEKGSIKWERTLIQAS